MEKENNNHDTSPNPNADAWQSLAETPYSQERSSELDNPSPELSERIIDLIQENAKPIAIALASIIATAVMMQPKKRHEPAPADSIEAGASYNEVIDTSNPETEIVEDESEGEPSKKQHIQQPEEQLQPFGSYAPRSRKFPDFPAPPELSDAGAGMGDDMPYDRSEEVVLSDKPSNPPDTAAAGF